MGCEPKYLPVATMYQKVTGHRPSPAAIYRWIGKGKLKTWLINGRRMTTESAVQEFIESTAAQKKKPVPQDDEVRAALAELDRELSEI